MIMVRGYTTISQSRKLVELGLDPSTADMAYILLKNDGNIVSPIPFVLDGAEEKGEYAIFYYLYCWSLPALLELMPDIHLKKYNYNGNTYYYITKVGIDTYNTNHYNTPIEAAVEMVCLLIENKYIKVIR